MRENPPGVPRYASGIGGRIIPGGRASGSQGPLEVGQKVGDGLESG
jgi:hypothetical protein